VPQHPQLLLFDAALQSGPAAHLSRFRHRPPVKRPAVRLVIHAETFNIPHHLLLFKAPNSGRSSCVTTYTRFNDFIQVLGRLHVGVRLRFHRRRFGVLRLDVP
jgi:hypothetical protein